VPETLLYIDPIGGSAGDMLLAALIHAGAPLPQLQERVAALDLGARLEVTQDSRQGIACRRLEVVAPQDPQPERHLSEVLAVIEAARLPQSVTERARAVFEGLAAAEAEVHDSTPEQVHFHEVGAIDAIVDVVGVLSALELLGVARVECGPWPVAGGTVEAAHGTLPLPAPAVLLLAKRYGAPLSGREGRGELVTPTGAALLGALAQRFGPFPALRVEAVGYGAGRRQSPAGSPPNLTRAVLGVAPGSEDTSGEVVVIETHLDDQSPEQLAWVTERLRASGALDVYLSATQTKKQRPGWLVTVLAEPARAGALEDVLLNESTSLGLRSRRERRRVLPRELVSVETDYGPIRVKRVRRPDGRVTRAPEFDDCARAAEEHGVPLREVFHAAEG